MDLRTLVESQDPAQTDEAILATVQAYTGTEGKLIPRNTMNSVLAQAGLYNTFLAAASTNDLIAAFMSESSTEYNFIQGNPTGDAQIAALDGLIASGNFAGLDELKPVILALANRPTTPHANATLSDIKAIRYPASWQLCTHVVGQDWIVSNSPRTDRLVFTVQSNEPVSNVSVRLKWREDGAQPWKTLAGVIRLAGGEGLYTDIQLRPVGLSNARHFQAEYLPEHAQQIQSVSLSRGQ